MDYRERSKIRRAFGRWMASWREYVNIHQAHLNAKATKQTTLLKALFIAVAARETVRFKRHVWQTWKKKMDYDNELSKLYDQALDHRSAHILRICMNTWRELVMKRWQARMMRLNKIPRYTNM